MEIGALNVWTKEIGAKRKFTHCSSTDTFGAQKYLEQFYGVGIFTHSFQYGEAVYFSHSRKLREIIWAPNVAFTKECEFTFGAISFY